MSAANHGGLQPGETLAQAGDRILWHLASSGNGLETLSSLGRLAVQMSTLERLVNRRRCVNYAAVSLAGAWS